MGEKKKVSGMAFDMYEGCTEDFGKHELGGLIDYSVLSSMLYLAHEGYGSTFIVEARNTINIVASNLWSLLPLTDGIIEGKEGSREGRDKLVKMINEHVEQFILNVLEMEKDGLENKRKKEGMN